jgi:hypothetical protein
MTKRISAEQIEQSLDKMGSAIFRQPTLREISSALGTVSHEWVRRNFRNGILKRVYDGLVARKIDGYVARTELARDLALDRAAEDLMSPVKMQKTSLKDKAITYGILDDHHRLATGQSTANIAVLHRHDIQDLDKLAGRLARALVSGPEPQEDVAVREIEPKATP